MAGVSDSGAQCAVGGDGVMEEFIKSVTEQIRCVKARAGVAKELSDHITDQAAAYEESGFSHDEAMEKAVREMGDPVGVGVELDRIHRPQADFKMIGMFFLFSVAGLVIMCAPEDMRIYPEEIVRQCVVVLLSFGVMAGVYFLDYTMVGRYAYLTGILLTIAMYIGKAYSLRWWIPIMFMMVYLYVPVYAAILYQLRGRGYSAVCLGIIMQFVIMVLAYALSGTLFAALNVYMMCTVLLLVTVWKRWYVVDRKIAAVISISVLVVFPVVMILLRGMLFGIGYGFQIQRILAWLHPDQYEKGAGYIYQWIRQEWEGVKLIGASAGNPFSDQNLSGDSGLTFATTPFILFRVICTYGLLAGLALILALVAVVLRAFRIVRRQKNQLAFIMAAACFLVFLVNCLEGILINTGYWPVSNLQLPFVSYGACTAMTYAAMIGLLLSIYRNEKVITSETETHRPVWRLSIKWEKR